MQRKPDVVIWGAGMVAGVHAAACQSLGWRVRAVASRDPDRAAALADRIGARTYEYDQLLPERLGDIAIVATPPANHVDDAVALLRAGYHVVVEAPIACTLADADRLIAAEQAERRPVLYSEHLAATPVVDGLLADIGAIGHLTHLSARAVQSPPEWRSTSHHDWGGGATFDLGVHPVGLALRSAAEAAAGPPTQVAAVITDAGTDREHASIKLRFSSGLLATIVVGWEPGATPDWDLQVSSASAVLRAELYPSPSLERNGDPVIASAGLGESPSLVDDYGYAPQLTRFWANIRTGRPVPATSRLGRQVLDVISAAHWSAGHNAIEVPLPFTGPRDRMPRDLLGTTSSA
ncbi:MAG TPA: Gfo/Idh/MocA family oxidoreductase [Ilumatobacteraceae bacterium]|nr:Gfo/Idh/MocA family oxidoreductase [Ilumatobacteraceae bacterium]